MTRLLFVINLQGIIYPILMWVCSVLTLYWQVTSMSLNIDFMSQDQRCTNCLWNTSLNNLNKLCGILPDLKNKIIIFLVYTVEMLKSWVTVFCIKNLNSLRNIFNQDKYVHLWFFFQIRFHPNCPFLSIHKLFHSLMHAFIFSNY